MANQFYKQQVGNKEAMQSAVTGPDMQEGYKANARRAESLANAMDGLVSATKGAVTWGNKVARDKSEIAAAKGKAQANAGQANSQESEDFWSGNAQTEAYNTTRGENAVADMPQFIEKNVAEQYAEKRKSNPDQYNKEFDELSNEERSGMATKAYETYLKDNKIVGSPYEASARTYGSALLNKTSQFINAKSREITNQKAEANVTAASMGVINNFKSPADIDEQIAAQELQWKQTLGDPNGTKTQTAVMKGVLGSVMKPVPNLDALTYLNSPEAKKRFGHIDGYDKADKHTTAWRKADVYEKKTGMENQFYSLLNVGELTNEAEVDAELGKYPDMYIDAKDKFILKNKALKHLRTTGEAETLQGAIATKNFGVVNAAKEDVRVAAFERNVMEMNEPVGPIITHQSNDPKDPILKKQNAFMAWMKDGFNPPQFVKQNLNTELVPTFDKGDPMLERIATHQKISRTLGRSGVSKLFDTDTQASVDMYNRIANDSSLSTPKDKALAYNKFVVSTKESMATGRSPIAAIQKEIVEPDFMSELQSFAQEGGGDTTFNFGVPSDLQPFMTTRNNSDMEEGGYAMKSLTGNYAVYRQSGLPKDQALRKAKDDFLYKNYWVEWDKKATYAPREYGTDFNVRGMEYAKGKGWIDQIAKQNGIAPEDKDIVESRISIEPSFDYATTRKMSVFYDGVEQPMNFSFREFSQYKGVTDKNELDALEKKDFDKRKSPEYIKDQERKQKFMKSLDRMRFGFGVN
jgi:hypothetical protein